MRIFVAAGIVLEGDADLCAHINGMIDRTRFIFQAHLDAKHAGDFGKIVRMEHFANNYAQWWHDLLPYWGCDATQEAITRFVEAERRYIRERTEVCRRCWHRVGTMPEDILYAPGSLTAAKGYKPRPPFNWRARGRHRPGYQ